MNLTNPFPRGIGDTLGGVVTLARTDDEATALACGIAGGCNYEGRAVPQRTPAA